MIVIKRQVPTSYTAKELKEMGYTVKTRSKHYHEVTTNDPILAWKHSLTRDRIASSIRAEQKYPFSLFAMLAMVVVAVMTMALSYSEAGYDTHYIVTATVAIAAALMFGYVHWHDLTLTDRQKLTADILTRLWTGEWCVVISNKDGYTHYGFRSADSEKVTNMFIKDVYSRMMVLAPGHRNLHPGRQYLPSCYTYAMEYLVPILHVLENLDLPKEQTIYQTATVRSSYAPSRPTKHHSDDDCEEQPDLDTVLSRPATSTSTHMCDMDSQPSQPRMHTDNDVSSSSNGGGFSVSD